jgi:hypothetical protein
MGRTVRGWLGDVEGVLNWRGMAGITVHCCCWADFVGRVGATLRISLQADSLDWMKTPPTVTRRYLQPRPRSSHIWVRKNWCMGISGYVGREVLQSREDVASVLHELVEVSHAFACHTVGRGIISP